ncbi:MAG: 2-C-methyl-D-erythritol 4-phosphate cytidylyltransferase [Phycisphaerae bacterium]
MPAISVIVPAAGSGRRFGSDRNKIFQPLCGRAIFLKTLEVFAAREDVIQILLVVSAADQADIRDQFAADLATMNVEVVLGGAVRSQSVQNALARLDDAADLVAVHDAVRPCVAQPWLDAVFAKAAETGAAMLAYPVHGTLKRVEDGVITDTVPRAGLWEAQTPQVFGREVILKAYDRDDIETVTDDAMLAEAIGQPVRVVAGDPRNIKITTPGDLELARAVINTLP